MPGQRKAGTTAILVRVQQADKQRIEQAAQATRQTVSDLCRQAIFAQVELIERMAKLPKK